MVITRVDPKAVLNIEQTCHVVQKVRATAPGLPKAEVKEAAAIAPADLTQADLLQVDLEGAKAALVLEVAVVDLVQEAAVAEAVAVHPHAVAVVMVQGVKAAGVNNNVAQA